MGDKSQIQWTDATWNPSAAVFVKQLGSVWAKQTAARHPKGGDPSEWPAALRVQEFPA